MTSRLASVGQWVPPWIFLGGAAGVLAAVATGQPSIVLGTVAVAAVLLLVSTWLLRDPAAGLAVLVGTYGVLQSVLVEINIERVTIGNLRINASQFFVSAMTAVASARILLELAFLRRRPQSAPSLIALLFLSAVISCTLIWGHVTKEAIGVVGHVITCAVGFTYCVLFCRTPSDFWKLWKGIAVAVAGTSLVAVLDLLVWRKALGFGAYHRAEGGFGGPVGTGTVAFVGLALGAVGLMAPNVTRRLRLMAYGTLLVSAAGILATFARTAIVGSILFVGLLLLVRPSGRLNLRRNILISACVVATFSVGYLFVNQETVTRRVKDLPVFSESSLENPNTGSGREMIWRTLARLQASAGPTTWVVGHGLLGTQHDLGIVIWAKLDAHNSSFDMLYDAGLVGLFAYWLFAGLLWRDLRRAGRSGHWLGPVAGVTLAYMIAYQFSTEMFNGYIYAVGPRFFSLLLAGAVIGVSVASRAARPHPALPAAESSAE